MTTTITATSAATTTPRLVLGYQTSRQVPTVLHRIIGRGDPDVTLQPAGLRIGSMDLFYLDEPTATAAVELLAVPGVFTLDDDDTPSMGMAFVVNGQLTTRLDSDTGRWVVGVGYAEVTP